jgi:hypothetical protein
MGEQMLGAPAHGSTTTIPGHPEVVVLGTPTSAHVDIVGAKAASLGRCARGLPVLPGFVLSTSVDVSALDDPDRSGWREVHHAWQDLSATAPGRWSCARRPGKRTPDRARWLAASSPS